MSKQCRGGFIEHICEPPDKLVKPARTGGGFIGHIGKPPDKLVKPARTGVVFQVEALIEVHLPLTPHPSPLISVLQLIEVR
ncbi:hypothetical protein [Chroococcidiopsis sp. CCMEE 29]|uniref:hypothetical protein n=1 Tax=Chroococcidiopsis sp. CCMEE 29 TaxID=155894 RepID=UPI0020205996|nr:hypothetical protein [Chroococcidiopsis sp. CCMEE 29]